MVGKPRRPGEMMRLEAEFPGRVDIEPGIVDEQCARGNEPRPLGQNVENTPMRLDDALIARNHGHLEKLQFRETLPKHRICLARHVGDAVERDAARLQAFHDLPRPRQTPRDHLLKAFAPHVDQGAMLGKFLFQRRRIVPEARPPIMRQMPRHGAHGMEEGLHLRLVVENLPVEMARVPAENHIAEIEDDRIDRTHDAFPSSSRKGKQKGRVRKRGLVTRCRHACDMPGHPARFSPDGL